MSRLYDLVKSEQEKSGVLSVLTPDKCVSGRTRQEYKAAELNFCFKEFKQSS